MLQSIWGHKDSDTTEQLNRLADTSVNKLFYKIEFYFCQCAENVSELVSNSVLFFCRFMSKKDNPSMTWKYKI